ncbi:MULTISPECIES: cytochrome b/b6 domain-containing protein [Pseudomonadati]|uniref:Cytochrome b/b6 domain-containing protein n=1 Tax=Shewanella aestuarii TaxID=1028752 RepID=A0ABT0KZA7_9GAMM|nr:cytochrome b/b6 domain-containing protein [Shewanella aestuarii]MCL1116799.1 cytochrome b/b6 domain-containing protein [Shewanella aestuarii]GGN73317.1 cytochrome b561 [Shewanella aestuarii]
MALLPIWRSIETKLHAAVLVMSLLLVCSSPWIFIAKQLSPKAGFWDVFHVYGGLFTAVIGLLFAIKVCTKGQWRLFFPWLVADFSQLKADIFGMVKGRLPLSGGKGLLSVIEGGGVILLLLVAISGVLWYLADPSDALMWRSYHKVFAQGFIGFIVIHLLLALLHIRDFFG